MQPVPLFAIDTARHCAWRAIYVAVRRMDGNWEYRHQIAHLGIDPTASRASIFGAVGRFHFRIPLPFTHWRYKQWHIKTLWQRFLQSLDGRY